MKKRNLLECTLCGTGLEVPLCCKKEMKIKDSEFVCMLCNSKEDIPICCGNVMIVAEH